MEKDDNIGKTPSLDGPSGALKSAVGVNVVDNLTANNNQDDVDTLPLSTLPQKSGFSTVINNRRAVCESVIQSPFKRQSKRRQDD
eukprot:scaffold16846_cov77-Skeletonema_menzelii.AAC.1